MPGYSAKFIFQSEVPINDYIMNINLFQPRGAAGPLVRLK